MTLWLVSAVASFFAAVTLAQDSAPIGQISSDPTCLKACDKVLSAERRRHRFEMQSLTRTYTTRLAALQEKLNLLSAVGRHGHGRANAPASIVAVDEALASIEGPPSLTSVGDSVAPFTRGMARDLLQDDTPAPARSCSKAEVGSLIGAAVADRLGILSDLRVKNAACAVCILELVGSLPMPDVLYAIHGCMHQNENRCDSATGNHSIAKLGCRISIGCPQPCCVC